MKTSILFFALILIVESVIQLELQQHSANRESLKERRAKLEKASRILPKSHGKFLEAIYQNEYTTTTIGIGSPLKNFTVMISSGATTAWVLDKTFNAKTANQSVYIPENSTTSISLNKTFEQWDGSFDSHGNWYTDVLHFGNAKVKEQAFGSVDFFYTHGDFSDILFPVDGVFGINHLSDKAYINGSSPTAPIDNLLKPLADKVVTLFLNKHRKPSEGPTKGMLTIGGFDNKNCQESGDALKIPFSNSQTENNLLVHVVSSFTYDTYSKNGGLAYIDTSISSIQVPLDVQSILVKLMQPTYDWNLELYIVPCNSISDLKYLAFLFKDSSEWEINPEDFVVDLELDGGQCVWAIEQVSPQYSELNYVLGTPFARNYCLVYNFDEGYIQLFD